MLFKSPILSQASGSLAGATFARNQGGMYIRGRGTVVDPNTPTQQARRAALTALSVAWSSLTGISVVEDWNAYAAAVSTLNALGDAIKLSAQNWFIAMNSVRRIATLADVTDAPTTLSLATFTTPVGSISAAALPDLEVAFNNTDDWAVTTGGALLVFVSSPQSPATHYFKGPFKFLNKVLGNTATPPTSPSTLVYPFNPVAGSIVFARYQVTNPDGRIGTPLIQRIVVAS